MPQFVTPGSSASTAHKSVTSSVQAPSRRPALAVGAVALALTLGGMTADTATARPLSDGGVSASGIDLQVPAPLAPAPAAPAAQPVDLARAFAVAGTLYAKTNALAAPAKPANAAKVSATTRSQVAAARTPAASRSTARVSGAPRQIGRALAAEKGWGGRQFACLDKLWTKESDWTTTADNPTSSAYGIPQALPGKRMASHGKNWRTDAATQIRWGLDYIDDRYGAPCEAWAHSRAKNWY